MPTKRIPKKGENKERNVGFDSSYKVLNLSPMKQMMSIFIFTISVLWANSHDTDVHHVIVKYNGKSIVASIDSIGMEFVYFVSKDTGDSDSLYLRDIY